MNSTPLTAFAAAFVSAAVVFVLRIYAETVFLAEFGSVYLPHFFAVHAVTLILASATYGACIRFGNTTGFDALMLLLLAGAAFAAPLAVRVGGTWLFVMTVTLLTLSTLALFASWNALTAVVRGRRERTFLPRAGAAATAGAMAGGFGALAVIATKGVPALAPIAAALALIALGLRLVLTEAVPGERAETHATRRGHARSSVPGKLVAVLAAAAVLESMLSVFVDFGFKQAIESSFRDREATMGIAFALYYGCTNAVLLFVQWFGATRLLAHRPLLFTLSIQPVVIFVIALAWLAFPVLLLATLARGFDQVLRFGVARPGQEVTLMPLSLAARKRWRLMLRGVYTQLGAALAGLAMIATGSWLSEHPSVTPAVAGLLASLLLALNRRVVGLYLQSLGNALGTRRLVLRDGQGMSFLDRDGLARLVQMTGSSDPRRARFASELLESSVPDPVALASHLPGQAVQIREVIYRQLARQHSPNALTSLRRSVASEPEQHSALAAGLVALAAHGDTSAVERARTLLGNEPPNTNAPVAAAAWIYLAWVGALDDDSQRYEAVLRTAIFRDGITASAVGQAALERASLESNLVDGAIIDGMHADDPQCRLEAMRAAASLGRAVPLTQLLGAMEQYPGDAQDALSSLGDDGVDELRRLAERGGIPSRVRTRVLLALRTSTAASAAELAADWLLDDDAIVRERAAHTLLKRMREDMPVPRAKVQKAIDGQLDRASAYVGARDAAPESLDLESGALFRIELECATARSLSRLCGLLALLGNPTTIHLAERALRSSSARRRGEAVDVLQEVVRGATRRRLIALLEHYLAPPATAPPDSKTAACRIDPWLATCARLGTAPIARYLSALRATTLFDSIPGNVLYLLAEQVDELSFDEGGTIVASGAIPKGLYVIIEGCCHVKSELGTSQRLDAGDTFGELSLVDARPDPMSLQGSSAGRALVVSREMFKRAMNEHPEIGFGLLRDLVQRLRDEAVRPSVNPRSGLRARAKEAVM